MLRSYRTSGAAALVGVRQSLAALAPPPSRPNEKPS
jgi:hypothetical protein